MAVSLKKFTAGQLADVLGVRLGRGRPSFELREGLESAVKTEMAEGSVVVRKGKLVRI